ncbi:unnamed protein product [Ambrosiozyma monospora]|uniref:Unnamed protein product n=1 Tax=Ambrosiozyma monospora TaxID=43982 RepID=A0ACB5T6H7_AMBMO|nr:unnamed protein product [Ambrosiozyma monospora]
MICKHSFSFENFINVKSLKIFDCDLSFESHKSNLTNQIENNKNLQKLTIGLHSILEPTDCPDPILHEVAELFKEKRLTVYLSLKTGRYLPQYKFLYKFIRTLHFHRDFFEGGCPLENALRECTSLQKLEIWYCTFAENYTMKLQNESIEKINILDLPFDFSGCPNVKKVEFHAPELKHYCDSLKDLRNFNVRKLRQFGGSSCLRRLRVRC